MKKFFAVVLCSFFVSAALAQVNNTDPLKEADPTLGVNPSTSGSGAGPTKTEIPGTLRPVVPSENAYPSLVDDDTRSETPDSIGVIETISLPDQPRREPVTYPAATPVAVDTMDALPEYRSESIEDTLHLNEE